MAYIGLLRAGGGAFAWGPLLPVRGKGNPLPLPIEFWGVGVGTLEVSFSSSGTVTENMRVMKMVRRLGSLVERLPGWEAGVSGGRVAGVYSFARWLLRRKPSARPREFVASWIVAAATERSEGFGSSGTIWILFEFPL